MCRCTYALICLCVWQTITTCSLSNKKWRQLINRRSTFQRNTTSTCYVHMYVHIYVGMYTHTLTHARTAVCSNDAVQVDYKSDWSELPFCCCIFTIICFITKRCFTVLLYCFTLLCLPIRVTYSSFDCFLWMTRRRPTTGLLYRRATNTTARPRRSRWTIVLATSQSYDWTSMYMYACRCTCVQKGTHRHVNIKSYS